MNTTKKSTIGRLQTALDQTNDQIHQISDRVPDLERDAAAALLIGDAERDAAEWKVAEAREALQAATTRRDRILLAIEVEQERELEATALTARKAANAAHAKLKARLPELSKGRAEEVKRHDLELERIDHEERVIRGDADSSRKNADALQDQRRRILEKRNAARLDELRARAGELSRQLGRGQGNAARTPGEQQEYDELGLRRARRELADFERKNPDMAVPIPGIEAIRQRLADAVTHEERDLATMLAARAAAQAELADVQKEIAGLLGA